MKRQRFWKIGLLLALPVALYAVVAARNSWRPKTLNVGAGYSAIQVAFSSDGKTLAVACDAKKLEGLLI